MLRRSTLILPGMAVLLMMTGCTEQEENPYKEARVINVYDTQSEYIGVQGGWYGKILQDEFNVQLNFLDTEDPESLGQADLLVCGGGSPGTEELMAEFELLNLEDYLEEDAEILDYREGIEYWNESLAEEGIYILPTQVSRLSEITPSEENVPRYGLYLNWEAYEEAGMPDIRDMDQLLDVMEQMKKSGQQGLVLCNDENLDLLDHITYLMGTQGYERDGLIVWREEGRESEGLLEEDSGYVETLLWLREAYSRGLLAAGCEDMSYEEMMDYYDRGDALLAIWSEVELNGSEGVAQAAASDSRMDESDVPGNGTGTLGKVSCISGYELAPIEDMKVVSYGCSSLGNTDVYVAVMADTEDPQRVVDLISWLYSTEGIMCSGTDTALKAAGPQGLTWGVEDGNPQLTEFGHQVLTGRLTGAADVAVPEEWGGGTWQEGSCKLSFQPVVSVEVSPSGFTYNYTLWETTIEQYSDASPSWQEITESDTPMEYLMRNDLLSVIPGYVENNGEENPENVDKYTTCREIIVDYSWKIIYSQTEEECQSLLAEMYRKAKAAGY